MIFYELWYLKVKASYMYVVLRRAPLNQSMALRNLTRTRDSIIVTSYSPIVLARTELAQYWYRLKHIIHENLYPVTNAVITQLKICEFTFLHPKSTCHIPPLILARWWKIKSSPTILSFCLALCMINIITTCISELSERCNPRILQGCIVSFDVGSWD